MIVKLLLQGDKLWQKHSTSVAGQTCQKRPIFKGKEKKKDRMRGDKRHRERSADIRNTDEEPEDPCAPGQV